MKVRIIESSKKLKSICTSLKRLHLSVIIIFLKNRYSSVEREVISEKKQEEEEEESKDSAEETSVLLKHIADR